jgi:FkbM family methyltransferase
VDPSAPVRAVARRGRHRLRQWLRLDPNHRPDVQYPTLYLGSAYGGWTINPTRLTSDSIVYSFGVGEDISFDIALIERYGVTVHAFDPTPRSVAWVGQQHLPSRFIFHDFGIANFDGFAAFFPPRRAEHVSYTVIADRNPGSSPTYVPVYRLTTILQMLDHSRVDLLKMDIEGAEYDVIDDLAETGVSVEQLLVEFQHRFRGVGAHRTIQTARRLREAGFRLFHVNDTGEDYSFMRA